MDTAWVGVIGTLAGVVVGWIGTLVSQKLAHRRDVGERLAASRRVSYLAWLSKVHLMYEVIAGTHRDASRGSVPLADASHRLRDLSATDAQTALEDLRLVATDDLAAAAAAVWGHMRRERVAIGQDMDPSHWRLWRDQYWSLRRAFLDAARAETGFPPLDWHAASVTAGKPKRF